MTVMNLATGEKIEYGSDLSDLTAREAVVCASRQMDHNDYNTWEYSKYLHDVVETPTIANYGDWTAFVDRRTF